MAWQNFSIFTEILPDILQEVALYNEHDLLLRIADGDEAAFTRLFNEYRPRVYSTVIMLAQNEDLALEMVQEVFAKIWMVRQQLPAIRDFEAWMFIVIRNAAYKTLQKIAHSRDAVRRAGLVMPEFTNETEESILFNDYRRILQEAVDRLPPQQQKVWKLAREQGLRRKEIAEKMHLKPDTVKEYLALATKTISAHCLARLGAGGLLLCHWLCTGAGMPVD